MIPPSGPESRLGRTGALRPERRSAADAGIVDRRATGRRSFDGSIVVVWHHSPGKAMHLPTVDISETGARIRASCRLPNGLTGMAVELLGDEVAPRLPIGRAVMVVWTSVVERDDGCVDHYETGLRFF